METKFEWDPEKMSENGIVRKSAEEIARQIESDGSGVDWDRVGNLTDADIEQAVREDPEQELLTEDWFRRAKLVIPGEAKEAQRSLPSPVCPKDALHMGWLPLSPAARSSLAPSTIAGHCISSRPYFLKSCLIVAILCRASPRRSMGAKKNFSVRCSS